MKGKGAFLSSMVLISLVVLLMLSSTASAAEFDNHKSYDPETKEITITNMFGLGSQIAKIRLLTPQDYSVIDKGQGVEQMVALMHFDVGTDWKNYDKALKKLDLYDMKRQGVPFTRSYRYKVALYDDVPVDRSYQVCDVQGKNGTECRMVPTIDYDRQIVGWIPISEISTLPAGGGDIGIFTDVQKGEKVEWVPTFFGIGISEWATWTENLDTNILSYYTWDDADSTSSMTTDVVTGTYNLTSSGVTWGGTGKINQSWTWDGVTNHYMYADEVLGISNRTEYTINGWVKCGSQSDKRFFAESNDLNSFYGLGSAAGAGTALRIFIRDDVGTIELDQTVGTLCNTAWVMVTILQNATGSLTVYFNGAYTNSYSFTQSGRNYTDTCFGAHCIGGGGSFYAGSMDEMGFWTRALNQSEITALYNSGTGIQYVYFPPAADLTVNLISPANGNATNQQSVILNATAISTGTNVTNMTFTLWDTSDSSVVNTTTFSSLNSISVNQGWEVSNLYDGTFVWNAFACTDSICAEAAMNNTLYIDSSAPSMVITGGFETYTYDDTSANSTFAFNITDPTLDTCWYTSDFNATKTYVSCSTGIQSYLNITTSGTYGWRNVTFSANDTYANVATVSSNTTIQRVVAPTTMLQNQNDTFQLYLYNRTAVPTGALLSFNGTNYTATVTNLSGVYTVNATLSTSLIGSVTSRFHYIDAGTPKQTPLYSTTVTGISFGICGGVLTVPYLNVTFADELNSSALSASIDSSSWEYWIDNRNGSQDYSYTNTTAENLVYQFCFAPGYETINIDYIISYSATSYPERDFGPLTTILSNATTVRTLYLLSEDAGTYVTFQTVDQNSDPLSSTLVTATTIIGGSDTVVGEGYTDASGTLAFWLNPNTNHNITFTRSGCTPTSLSVTPSQSAYTIVMDCTTSVSYTASPVDGIIFQKSPITGVITTGNHTFYYTVTSISDNVTIQGAKFELYYVNETLIGSNETFVNQSYASCVGSQCNLSITYDVQSGDNLKGRYYVDVGDGYVLLEADAFWRNIEVTPGQSSLKNALSDLKQLFSDWTQPSCLSSYDDLESYNCTSDDLVLANKIEFSRIVFIFFIMAVILAVFGRFTGYDGTNPGAFLLIFTGIVTLLSMSGGVGGEGLFYYSGLFLFPGGHFLNNYILAGVLIVMTLGYWAMLSRRQT